MALNYEQLMALKRTGDRFSYTDRETMLYAIGIGMSRDPYDENELAFTFEKAKLKTVASMATVLQRVPLLKDCGYDYSKVVHGEQRSPPRARCSDTVVQTHQDLLRRGVTTPVLAQGAQQRQRAL